MGERTRRDHPFRDSARYLVGSVHGPACGDCGHLEACRDCTHPMTTPTAPLTAEWNHGVGFVDRVGIECMCGYTVGFDSGVGGWVAFNRHLRAAVRAEADVLRAAIPEDPTYSTNEFGDRRCFWCDNEWDYGQPPDHATDCAWLAARAAMQLT